MNFFSKKSLLFFAFIAISCLFSNRLFSQITVAGSTSQDGVYTSLTNAGGAFPALNGTSQVGRNITISITADVTTEAGTNALTGAAGMWTSLTISPSGGAARTISGAFANGLITFTNADNVTIDGLNSGGNSLIIANTTAGATANAIRFINDASGNTIKNCIIKGSNTSSISGVIFFSTAGTTGNDNNLIDYCDIGPNGASLPANCIYSLGTAAMDNDNNTVSNCYIHDFFLAAGASGILIESNNSGWTISENSFYQVATRDGTYNVIKINNSAGVGFSVSGNYIGGDSPLAAVSAQKFTVSSASARELIPIYLSVGTTAASTVQNNIIKNISFTAKTDGTEFFSGIWVADGNVNVTGNVLGDNATGSITLSITGNGANVAYVEGIQYYNSSGTRYGNVTNNTIGSITIGGTLNNNRYFNSINYGATLVADVSITGNVIGNATTGNSIQTSGGTNPPSAIYGISSSSTGSFNINISNNVVANMTEVSTDNSTINVMYGIISSDAGNVTISNNSIHDLATATQNSTSKGVTNYLAFIGIAGSDGVTIDGNSVYNMRLTSLTATPLTYGIFVNHGTGNIISDNIINNLQANADGTMIYGIGLGTSDGSDVSTTVSNNMVRLGYKTDGTSVNYATYYSGIFKQGPGASYFYFNTVYIGGTGVNNVAANYSAAFERETNDATDSDICMDNIFVNERTNAGAGAYHYAIVINAITNFISNYNDLFTTAAANLGSYDAGTTPGDFTAWKAGTGQDANSINTDVSFVDAVSATPNLHISPTFCGVADLGIVISGITTDFDGNNRATGNAATLTGPDIGADEYSGNIDPVSVLTNCSESTVLTVTGYGAGTLQWMESDDNGTTDSWVNAIGGSGATTATYTSPALTQTIYYRVAVTNGCVAYSNSGRVDIDPTITVQPVPTTACTGLPTSFSVTAIGSGITYQWQISPTGAGGPFNNLSDAGVYSNVTTSTLNISDATGLNGNYYRCIVTSCAFPVYSTAVLLTVTGISTRYWAGAGTVLTGGTAGTDFNADGNWSTTGPAGAATLGTTAPSACTDVVFTTTNTFTVTLSASTTINSLLMNHSGVNDVFTLGMTAFTLTINGNTATDITGGNGATKLILNPGTGAIVYGGNATFAASSGATYCLYSGVDGQGNITFNGDVTFNAGASGTATRPGIVYFDGSGSQYIANNQSTSFIRLGTISTEIGRYNSPTVTITANLSNTLEVFGNLNINSSSILDLSTFTLNRSAAGGSLILASGATLKLAGLTASSNYPLNFTTNILSGTVEYYAAGGQTISRTSTPSDLALTYNNLTLTGSGAKTLAANTTVIGTLSIGGTGPVTFALGGFTLNYGASAKLKYNSSVEQTAATDEFPSPFTPTGGVEIANTSATGLNLGASRTINSVLTLTNGNLITTSVNILTMAAGSSVSPVGGSSSSYVDGPIKKTGTTSFIFPIGDNGKWRRIAVGIPTASVTFTAEYVNAAYIDLTIKTEAAQMDAISGFEYWVLDEDIPTVDATVALFWEDATASGIDDCPDLVLAHYDGTDWENPYDGNFSTSGSCSGTNSGSVSTTVNVTSFGPFTFGSKIIGKNPLNLVTNLFWVGGSGNWNDPDHWSTSTGGPFPSGGSEIPGINTNVYFDNNSGTQPYTITIPAGTWYTKVFSLTGEGAKTPILGQGILLPRP